MAVNRAYLSFGSNICPRVNIRMALEELAACSTLVAVSSVWQTKPVGFTDQPDFLNGAVIIDTALNAADLKHHLLARIERDLGRIRLDNKNAARTIDLDIILFNQAVLQVDDRPIPSPELYDYAFVAIPLAEIAPDYIHPVTGDSLATIARRFAGEAARMQRIGFDFEL